MKENKTCLPQLFRIKTAAGMLGVDEKTLRKMIRRKDIAYHHIPERNIRISEKDIDRFLEKTRRVGKNV